MRLCGLFKLNIKVYLELFDGHCLRQSDFYKIVYNSILCGLNQSDGFLFTKMATCRDPSDHLHYPIFSLVLIDMQETPYTEYSWQPATYWMCVQQLTAKTKTFPQPARTRASGGFRDSSGCCCIQTCLWHIWLVEWSLFLFRQGSLIAITWIRPQSVTGELYGGGTL